MIRVATREDLDAVNQLVHDAYVVYVPRIGLRPGPMDTDHAAEIDRGELHVLEHPGQIVGVVVLATDDPVLWIENIAVTPDAQGRGYGSELLDFAERVALEQAFSELRLYTHELMTENIDFYSRRGFEVYDRRPVRDFRRVFMRREISR